MPGNTLEHAAGYGSPANKETDRELGAELHSPLAEHEANAKRKADELKKTVDAMYPPQTDNTKKQTALELATEAMNELGTEGGEGVGIRGMEKVTKAEDEKNMAMKKQEENTRKAWERSEVERQAQEQLAKDNLRETIKNIGEGDGENNSDTERSNTPKQN